MIYNIVHNLLLKWTGATTCYPLTLHLLRLPSLWLNIHEWPQDVVNYLLFTFFLAAPKLIVGSFGLLRSTFGIAFVFC